MIGHWADTSLPAADPAPLDALVKPGPFDHLRDGRALADRAAVPAPGPPPSPSEGDVRPPNQAPAPRSEWAAGDDEPSIQLSGWSDGPELASADSGLCDDFTPTEVASPEICADETASEAGEAGELPTRAVPADVQVASAPIAS